MNLLQELSWWPNELARLAAMFYALALPAPFVFMYSMFCFVWDAIFEDDDTSNVATDLSTNNTTNIEPLTWSNYEDSWAVLKANPYGAWDELCNRILNESKMEWNYYLIVFQVHGNISNLPNISMQEMQHLRALVAFACVVVFIIWCLGTILQNRVVPPNERPGPRPPFAAAGAANARAENVNGSTSEGAQSRQAEIRNKLLFKLERCSKILSSSDQVLLVGNTADNTTEVGWLLPKPGVTLALHHRRAPAAGPLRIVDGMCSICFDSFATNESVSWSAHHKCTHSFHQGCIADWLVQTNMTKTTGTFDAKNACPYCQRPFVKNYGAYLQRYWYIATENGKIFRREQ